MLMFSVNAYEAFAKSVGPRKIVSLFPFAAIEAPRLLFRAQDELRWLQAILCSNG